MIRERINKWLDIPNKNDQEVFIKKCIEDAIRDAFHPEVNMRDSYFRENHKRINDVLITHVVNTAISLSEVKLNEMIDKEIKNNESFIDDVVYRINRKQLKKKFFE